MKRLAVLYGAHLSLAAMLAACAPAASPCEPTALATQTGTAEAASMNRAAQMADRLARAESAYEAGDFTKLASILAAFAASPPHALQADEARRLEEWARAAQVDIAPMRGRVLGPGYMRGTLRSGESWTREQNFLAGEPASLAVSHRGSGPVALRVSQNGGSPVCSFRASASKVCRFTPIYTQRYRIELNNEGTQDAVYYVVID